MVSNQLHNQLLDSLATAVILLDRHLSIAYMNPAAESLLATSAQRISGCPARQLFGNSEKRIAALQSALRSGHSFTERRAHLAMPDQNEITVDFSVSPLVRKGEPMLLVELQQQDRILRISREEALISAHDTSRNLIRGMAHEIKNPLGGIRGAAQLLAAELSNPELLEYTDIIAAEVERLCNLVDKLLGPNTIPEFHTLNIHEVLEHVATLVGAESRGEVNISRDYDPSIPEIHGSREHLIQAVLNLVRNALQALQAAEYSDGEGSIILRSRIQRNFTIGKVYHRVVCRLDVIDNGPGIPEAIRDRIFYPMISGRPEGSGLGLPIAQAAINMHLGLIECDSTADGTQFSIYLPIYQNHE